MGLTLIGPVTPVQKQTAILTQVQVQQARATESRRALLARPHRHAGGFVHCSNLQLYCMWEGGALSFEGKTSRAILRNRRWIRLFHRLSLDLPSHVAFSSGIYPLLCFVPAAACLLHQMDISLQSVRNFRGEKCRNRCQDRLFQTPEIVRSIGRARAKRNDPMHSAGS